MKRRGYHCEHAFSHDENNFSDDATFSITTFFMETRSVDSRIYFSKRLYISVRWLNDLLFYKRFVSQWFWYDPFQFMFISEEIHSLSVTGAHNSVDDSDVSDSEDYVDVIFDFDILENELVDLRSLFLESIHKRKEISIITMLVRSYSGNRHHVFWIGYLERGSSCWLLLRIWW